jgi:hypothetical protein
VSLLRPSEELQPYLRELEKWQQVAWGRVSSDLRHCLCLLRFVSNLPS